jgi:hypothetical protein
VPLFAQARAQAADLLRGLEPGTRAGVIVVGARPRAVLPALSENLAALHEGLAAAKPTFEKGRPEEALALAERMLDGRGAVCIFSDFQRTDWGGVAFDRQRRVFLRPVGAEGVRNVGLRAVRISPGEPVEGETVEVACELFNATPLRRRETVRLDIEGVTQRRDVSLQPWSAASAVFGFSLPRPGCFAGRVSLDPDALEADNTRYLRVRVRERLRVLLVSDAEPGGRTGGAFFVQAALRPSDYASTGLEVVRRHSQAVDRTSLETADAFVLVSPTNLPGEAAETIARRLADGAHLACFLDGPTAPRTLAALAAASRGAVRPPFELVRPVAVPAGEPWAELRTADGPLHAFSSPEQGDLRRLTFRRHFLTHPDPDRREEVLARYADGAVALALSPAGRGRAVFANCPVDTAGSNLAGSPLFPALVHELLRALRASAGRNAGTPGRPWRISVRPGAAGTDETAFAVVGPDGAAVDATVVARGRTVQLGLVPADRPGHYTVRAGGSDVDLAVVNVDPAETDTRSLDLGAVTVASGGGEGGGATVVEDEGALATAGAAERPLWPYLALAAAALLAAEKAVLAFWRRRAPAARLPALEGRAA